LDAVERFRVELADTTPGAARDACGWQSELMRFLADRRDRLISEGARPEAATRDVLGRIAAAVGTVERMRVSDDPQLSGPPPENPRQRDIWVQVRATRLHGVEDELDAVLALVRREQAPELISEAWPVRMISCLTACERFFEERVRLGDDRATSRDVALAQWSRLLLAAEALDALSRLRR
jgi:hypothetical protein